MAQHKSQMDTELAAAVGTRSPFDVVIGEGVTVIWSSVQRQAAGEM